MKQISTFIKKGAVGYFLALMIAPTGSANPNGANVVSGNAMFSHPSANILEIVNAPNTIIDWENFSISANEITRFIQQGSDSSILNRVIGGNPTEILGQLLSNGQVWLINKNGMVFGDSAVVDTAGFVGSTLDISNQDYLSGNLDFGAGTKTGAIVNNGLIKTNGNGDILFIAPNIENHGIIKTQDGDLILAAGRKVSLGSLDHDHVSFEVQAPDDSAVNLGKLLANGGSIGAFASKFRNSGTIQANRISRNDKGEIILVADNNQISGLVEARGIGQNGGKVSILGDNIQLEHATINVDGTAGGEVLIGGDYQGQGTVQTAHNTSIDEFTIVNADALDNGDGGKIIVWADNHTDSFGKLSARGGIQSGDGGLIETSGKSTLAFGQPADVSATNGSPGTWLLDPSDISIGTGEAASIAIALNGGSNVSIKTSDSGNGEGNIDVTASIHKSEGDDASLTLQAHNEIRVNADITSTSNKLDVKLIAGARVDINGSINSNGGNVDTSITGIPDSLQIDVVSDDSEMDQSDEILVVEMDADNDVVVSDSVADEAEDAGYTAVSPVSESDQTQNVIFVPNTAIDGFAENSNSSIAIDGGISTGGGAITIDSGEQGYSLLSGVLDTSNLDAGETGGNIHVLGDQVALIESAKINASGSAGGGDILIGGDYQGNNPNIQNATNTFVDENVSIEADAIIRGNGGKVIIWSDDSTIFDGSISARGGVTGGDGAFVEVSGKQNLRFTGQVDVSSPMGDNGTLLLDPDFIFLTDTLGTNDGEVGDRTVAASDGVGTFFIQQSAINAALAGGNVDLAAGFDITVDTSITGSGNNLDLTAGQDIIINDALNFAGGDINLVADRNVNTSGAGTITADNLSIIAGGGVAGGIINASADITVTGNASFQSSGGTSNITGTNNFGTITVNNDGNLVPLTTIVNISEDSDTEFAGNSLINGTFNLITNGDISDGATAELVTTTGFSFDATGSVTFNNGTGVGVNHDFAVLSGRSTVAGNISITETDGFTIGTVNGIAGLSTTTGGASIQVEATAGSITVNDIVNARDNSNLTLTANGGNIVVNDRVITTDAITGVAGDGRSIITINGETGITINGSGSVETDVNTGSPTAGVLLTSTSGAITGSGAGADVRTDLLLLTADTGINALSTNANALDAITNTGDISIIETNALAIGTSNPTNGISTGDGDISITAAGTIDINENVQAGQSGGGNVTLLATTGDINVAVDVRSNDVGTGDGSGILALTATFGSINQTGGALQASTGSANLVAANDIGSLTNRILTDVDTLTAHSTVAGDVYISESNAIDLAGITTTASDIDIISGGTLNATSLVAGGTGFVNLQANGDILVGSINSGSTVSLNATAGDILDQQLDNILDIIVPGNIVTDITLSASGVISPSTFELELGTRPIPETLEPETPVVPILPDMVDDIIREIPLIVEDMMIEIPNIFEDIVNQIVTLSEDLGLVDEVAIADDDTSEDSGDIALVERALQCL